MTQPSHLLRLVIFWWAASALTAQSSTAADPPPSLNGLGEDEMFYLHVK
jgi:hypothetical protein